MKKVSLVFLLILVTFVILSNNIYASSELAETKFIVMETKRFFESKIIDDDEVVNEVSEDYATKKIKADTNITKLKEAYSKYKVKKIDKEEVIEDIKTTITAINELDDGGGGSGGSYKSLIVNYNLTASTTEVEIDQIYHEIIAYSRFHDGYISNVITKIEYNPNSNSDFLLRSTYTTYSSVRTPYRDYMALGYPDYLMPVESTIKWTKLVEFNSELDSFTRSETGDKFNTAHGDNFDISDNGIIWNVKPYSSYFAYIYPVDQIPQYDNEGNYLSSIGITKSIYELEVRLVTVRVIDVFDDFNMTLWSDYQHIIDKITITFNLNLRAYIGVSSNIGFLGVTASMTLAPDKSRRSAIQLIHV
ncbi:MAG: hypothetical protein A2Y45_02835 [Tenericutes bacterium GWC2_34_14]|nr:MAG: hypothetical protein A2Z84_03785 [Tenericutes bacterium GWA2_35_7]OHE28988.1 MAG: hypothetical protein A2Y45_02835 [Tenericutes bacterium GWC2_34_14]OHE33941.1 MAG: hypothetical protein A2012_06375 [Tenericutes bacterium GWE2_34_108]OHE35274.1 MAG: hypothetical protein A2Y46_04095 [Tenericutes bacterium GWF1_35_14]OHE38307.1 MAG: hypothetical protein A2Y44_03405 [Tenericutes bacterium GWF2_35_184]OHE42482.1 MAG: hypothetical protein A3K26_03720 [Tenericutes bacterium RIFOXYA12_FULL_35_